jgi:hypothetical protein
MKPACIGIRMQEKEEGKTDGTGSNRAKNSEGREGKKGWETGALFIQYNRNENKTDVMYLHPPPPHPPTKQGKNCVQNKPKIRVRRFFSVQIIGPISQRLETFRNVLAKIPRCQMITCNSANNWLPPPPQILSS